MEAGESQGIGTGLEVWRSLPTTALRIGGRPFTVRGSQEPRQPGATRRHLQPQDKPAPQQETIKNYKQYSLGLGQAAGCVLQKKTWATRQWFWGRHPSLVPRQGAQGGT